MVGNVEDAKEVVFEYDSKLSSILGQRVNHQMSAMKRDEFATALIPRETELKNCIALKTTGDGNCMFNAASMWFPKASSKDYLKITEVFKRTPKYFQRFSDIIKHLTRILPKSSEDYLSLPKIT